MQYAFLNSWNMTYTKMNRRQFVAFKNVILHMSKLMFIAISKNNLIISFRHFKYLLYCNSRLRSARDIDVTSLLGVCIS